MASNKGSKWDSNWSKPIEKEKDIINGFVDDPLAKTWDSYGRVFNNYGTEPAVDRCWTRDEALQARRRPAKHLYKKKY